MCLSRTATIDIINIDQNGYNYLTISKDFERFKYVSSAKELNQSTYKFIKYDELNIFDSINIDNNRALITELDMASTQADEEVGAGTSMCIGDTTLTMYSEDNKSLGLTESGITGDIVPKSVRPIIESTEDGKSPVSYLMNLEETGEFKFEALKGNIDVSVGENERYVAREK